jgi:hypothetical protein
MDSFDEGLDQVIVNSVLDDVFATSSLISRLDESFYGPRHNSEFDDDSIVIGYSIIVIAKNIDSDTRGEALRKLFELFPPQGKLVTTILLTQDSSSVDHADEMVRSDAIRFLAQHSINDAIALSGLVTTNVASGELNDTIDHFARYAPNTCSQITLPPNSLINQFNQVREAATDDNGVLDARKLLRQLRFRGK